MQVPCTTQESFTAARRPPERLPLTFWERSAFRARFDLADGHPRHVTSGASAILVEEGSRVTASQDAVEDQFTNRFVQTARQTLSASLCVIFHHSASNAIDVCAKAVVADGGRRVGVHEPTFDNLPALFKRQGLECVPICEDIWADSAYAQSIVAEVDALFIVLPSNPTGREPTFGEFRRMVDLCSETGTWLLLDFSFRFFGDLAEWDQYLTLGGRHDLKALCVEDTSKTWALDGLKVSLLVATPRCAELATQISEELLLNMSPRVISVVERAVAEESRLAEAHSTIAHNRALLRDTLSRVGWRPDDTSRAPVEWVKVPMPMTAVDAAEILLLSGVSVLPGGPFFWSEPSSGSHHIRFALFRGTRYFASAMDEVETSLTAAARRRVDVPRARGQ
jgi:aspartate/methionine/tyrosine aminotransferase